MPGSYSSVVGVFGVARHDDHVLSQHLVVTPDGEVVLGFGHGLGPKHAGCTQTHLRSVSGREVDVGECIEPHGLLEHEHPVRVKERVLDRLLLTLQYISSLILSTK